MDKNTLNLAFFGARKQVFRLSLSTHRVMPCASTNTIAPFAGLGKFIMRYVEALYVMRIDERSKMASSSSFCGAPQDQPTPLQLTEVSMLMWRRIIVNSPHFQLTANAAHIHPTGPRTCKQPGPRCNISHRDRRTRSGRVHRERNPFEMGSRYRHFDPSLSGIFQGPTNAS